MGLRVRTLVACSLAAVFMAIRPAAADGLLSPNEQIYDLNSVVDILDSAYRLPPKDRFETVHDHQVRLEQFIKVYEIYQGGWFIIGQADRYDDITPIFEYDAERAMVVNNSFGSAQFLSDFAQLKGDIAVGPMLSLLPAIDGPIELAVPRALAKERWPHLRMIGYLRAVFPYVSLVRILEMYRIQTTIGE